MDDLISRQMLLEYIHGEPVGKLLCDKYNLDGLIEQFPSAQPEIIHCRDCKHRGEKPIADGRYWCEIHDTFMYYCSDAERRTDEQT